jgi:hypothetical protein
VIFFGKGGDIATNRRDEQELSVLCLRVLQAALVYVNTLKVHRSRQLAGSFHDSPIPGRCPHDLWSCRRVLDIDPRLW